MARFAAATRVSVDQTRTEIERTLSQIPEIIGRAIMAAARNP